MLFLTQH
jgi:hypothetical protein